MLWNKQEMMKKILNLSIVISLLVIGTMNQSKILLILKVTFLQTVKPQSSSVRLLYAQSVPQDTLKTDLELAFK